MAFDPTGRVRSPRFLHGLAYGCFLPPGIAAFVSALPAVIPMGTGTAGGIGFLLLIPLALLSLASVPYGLYLAFRFRGDLVLLAVAAATVAMLVMMFTEPGTPRQQNFFFGAYGAFILVAVASWLLWRRKRVVA
ncbi:MAG TPA: hypothetical protein VFR29_00845 [Steroidobacteraceae bacterium]|nr:hypothetical protein [Steroidobacteraceae bacterium]